MEILQKFVNYNTINSTIQQKLLKRLHKMQAMMTNIMDTQQYNFQPPPYVKVKGGIKRSRGGGSGCSTGRFGYKNFPCHYHYYFWSYGDFHAQVTYVSTRSDYTKIRIHWNPN